MVVDAYTGDTLPTEIRVIDSHTSGEPTRVVVAGGPPLGNGPLPERARLFRERFDHYRSAIVCEPRGADYLVGALLVEPTDTACVAGVIFFNNVGLLGMCGHGTIGLAVTLAHLGRITPGRHRLETPVGQVGFEYHDNHRVTIQNVPSYRHRRNVRCDVPGLGTVRGDVAWGGNWFFIAEHAGHPLKLEHVDSLTASAWQIRLALREQGITGADGAEIDHIELTGPPEDPHNHGRNFVLCPGKAYDRSPCGTGTSAKVACLIAEGKLSPGEPWRQESITGGLFTATAEMIHGEIIPLITGTAFLMAESTLLFHPQDPLRAAPV